MTFTKSDIEIDFFEEDPAGYLSAFVQGTWWGFIRMPNGTDILQYEAYAGSRKGDPIAVGETAEEAFLSALNSMETSL